MASLARALAAVSLAISIGSADAYTASNCKNLPGDAGWPSPSAWSKLNATLKGQLIATVPQAHVCHTLPSNSFNANACDELQSTWTQAETYVPKPAEILNAYFQNQSCDPFTPISRSCELGNYASYSINVTTAQHVAAGFDFARQNNVRLVVKTTGHDFMGKSTGKGALSLWMANLKEKTIIPSYSNPNSTYKGPAIKLGSGVIAGEADEFVGANGYRVVTGECASTGPVGGYTQGGGHSLLGGAYGMAADNVLEWEVVTPQGDHVIATPSSYSDLYWAISGGGGGTYGVVLSMTTKIYPDGKVATGSLSFTLAGSGSAGNDETAFWQGVNLWFQSVPGFLGLKRGTVGSENATMLSQITNSSFALLGITFPDQTVTQLQNTLAPYLDGLKALNINYTFSTTQQPSYVQSFNQTRGLGPLPWGVIPTTEVWASRLVPVSFVENATAVASLVDVYRSAVQDNAFSVGCNVLGGFNAPAHPDNSVFPGWRDLAVICNVLHQWDFTAPLDTNLSFKRRLVSEVQPAVEAVTPGTGVYLNEMDPWYEGDFKTEMYGVNYDKLLSIKHKYDPDSLLWGLFAVGGDESTLDANGRLCRV
ncbi:putative FAD-dependent isoamyl alcohol oxidase [Trichoderma sp. SZMC 28011]